MVKWTNFCNSSPEPDSETYHFRTLGFAPWRPEPKSIYEVLINSGGFSPHNSRTFIKRRRCMAFLPIRVNCVDLRNSRRNCVETPQHPHVEIVEFLHSVTSRHSSRCPQVTTCVHQYRMVQDPQYNLGKEHQLAQAWFALRVFTK